MKIVKGLSIVIVMICLCNMTVYIWRNSWQNHSSISPTSFYTISSGLRSLGDFPGNVSDCSLLYKNESLASISQHYKEHKESFDKYLKANLKETLEGNVGIYTSQLRYYYHLVTDLGAKTICEIGFNAGHSTLVWLTSNPNTRVYSFDIGAHKYTRKMAEYLKSKFPKRLTLIFGNSLHTVPAVAQLEILYCDILVVDGGHSYKVANKDLQNMKALAKKNHVLIYDDNPSFISSISKGLAHAWQEQINTGNIKETFHCTYKFIKPSKGGFTLGYYTNVTTVY